MVESHLVNRNQTNDESISTAAIKNLKAQLVIANNINAKLKHDYTTLEEEKNNLRNENYRLVEQIDYLHAKQSLAVEEMNRAERNNEEYGMLVEVKNNLQDENDRLMEEIDYLTSKQKTLQRKLEAERSLRVSVEEELQALEDKNRRDEAYASTKREL